MVALPKPTLWNFLYFGAVLCVLISVVTIYQITVSGDVSNEWIIWLSVIVGFSLFGGGYLYELRYKQTHPEEPETV